MTYFCILNLSRGALTDLFLVFSIQSQLHRRGKPSRLLLAPQRLVPFPSKDRERKFVSVCVRERDIQTDR